MIVLQLRKQVFSAVEHLHMTRYNSERECLRHIYVRASRRQLDTGFTMTSFSAFWEHYRTVKRRLSHL